MRKNTNSFSDGNRSVKRVLGAGSRVGMAALIAASATSPVDYCSAFATPFHAPLLQRSMADCHTLTI